MSKYKVALSKAKGWWSARSGGEKQFGLYVIVAGFVLCLIVGGEIADFKNESAVRAQKKEHDRRIESGFCFKCGSYCYGKCEEANDD